MNCINSSYNKKLLNKLRVIQDERLYNTNTLKSKWLLFDHFFDVYYEEEFEYVALIFSNYSYKLFRNEFQIIRNTDVICIPYISTEEEYFMQSTVHDFESLELCFEVMIEVYNFHTFITNFIRRCKSVYWSN